MRRFALSLAALFLAGAAPSLVGTAHAQPAPASPAVGVTSAVVREAKLSNARITRPRALALRERIALADLIQTGKASQVQIMLLDRSVFSIGANAQLRIDRFVYDPAGRSMAATAARGAFRFMSGAPARQNGSTIATPVATIGIRGTILEGAVGPVAVEIARREPAARAAAAFADPQTASLVVLRGPGAGSAGVQAGAISVTAGGATVDLGAPMLAAFVPRAGSRPIGPFVLSAAGLGRLQDAIFPAWAKKGNSALKTLAAIGAAAGAAAIIGTSGNGGNGGNDDTQPPATGGQTGP